MLIRCGRDACRFLKGLQLTLVQFEGNPAPLLYPNACMSYQARCMFAAPALPYPCRQVRPYVLQDELCIAVGSVHTLASFQASMCVSGKLPRALGLYDNIARVARLLRRGQEPWEPVYMDGASSPFPE